jgi:hypothetical protein
VPGSKPVAELAERIKALKAGHHVDAPSERAGKRPAASAEGPVTARIRRRAAVVETGTDASDAAERGPSGMTHLERLAMEQHKEHEPGPL